MSTRPLLEGTVIEVPDLGRLREENARLSDALQRAIDNGNQMRNELRELQQSIQSMRIQLSPLYRSLCGLFGELDRVSKETDFSAGAQVAGNSIWESWKKKMPGKPAEFIALLQTHGEMTGAQLSVAGKCSKKTVYDTVTKLNRAQLLVKNGGKFSLKPL